MLWQMQACHGRRRDASGKTRLRQGRLFCCIRGLFAIRVRPPFAFLERTALAAGADSGSDARKRPSDRFSRYASDADPTMMRSAASWRTVLECEKKAKTSDIGPASAAITGQDSTGAHCPSEQASTPPCAAFSGGMQV